MFRGNRGYRSTLWASWLLAACLAAGTVSPGAFAGPTPAASSHDSSDVTTGKMTAPTMEDNANYFSKNRRGISPAALKKADALRRKTMASIESLLKSKKNAGQRFELLLRVGELHVERHDYIRDLESAAWDKAWKAWDANGRKGPEPKLSTTNSDNEMAMAANSFRRLVTEFPKHPRTDAALYSLGRVLARMGKDTSVDYYKQLVRTFPKSPLLPDTYLSLGEYYFDKHDIPQAITYYKKVMDYKDHRAFPYAVYKLGWAYYDSPGRNDQETQANYKKAVAAFKLVVKLSDKDQDGQASHNFDLREEALKDLVMVWADAEDVASAWRYFRSIGEKDQFYKMLERLGNIYADQGKNQQAISVFQRLLKEAPTRENNPSIHEKIVALDDVSNDIAGVVTELKNMDHLYLGNTTWTAANKGDKTAIKEAQRLCELNTHRYGAMYHQRGEKAKSDQYLLYAANIYTLYLASFPKNPNAYDIRYYLAEIQFDHKQYEAASANYLIVAKANPTGKYMKPAAFNSVAAMNSMVQSTKWPQLPPPGQVPQPLAIPHAKQELVGAIDTYVAMLPKEKDGDPMRFTAAQTYFDYGHYDEALARFEKITKVIPQTKQAKISVKVILGYYADKEDWTNLKNKAQAFTRQDKLLDKDLRKYVVDVLRGAMFKQALAYEKSQQFEQAAHSFVDYEKAFPSDANADRALYNAMLNYYKVEKIEDALATAKTLLDKYPKSGLVPDVLANVGSTNEALAKFDEAAAAYKRLALTFPQDKRSPNALYNAAVLYKGLKNLDEASSLLSEFGRRYGNTPIGPDANMELASLYERRGRYGDAVQAYQAYGKRYGGRDQEQTLYAAAKAASLEVTNGDKSRGMRDLSRVKQQLMAKNAPAAYEARATVAGTMFKLAEPAFGDFQATTVTDGSRIEQQVQAKQAKLVKLAANYEQIIDLGAAEFTVASLYRLGEAHENFANALFKAPAPKGASQADIDKLKTELEKVAFPLKDQAYQYFETAYKRSKEVETFTAWTQRTYQKMVELAPDKHPEVNALSADPTYLSHDVKLSKAVSDLVDD